MKAKAVYKFRKVFNQKYLKTQFDIWMLKAFGSVKKLGRFILNPEAKRLIELGRLLNKRLMVLNASFFKPFVRNGLRSRKRNIAIKRILAKNQ